MSVVNFTDAINRTVIGKEFVKLGWAKWNYFEPPEIFVFGSSNKKWRHIRFKLGLADRFTKRKMAICKPSNCYLQTIKFVSFQIKDRKLLQAHFFHFLSKTFGKREQFREWWTRMVDPNGGPGWWTRKPQTRIRNRNPESGIQNTESRYYEWW